MIACILCVLAAGAGALKAVFATIKLAPSEAMRPPAPARFHGAWVNIMKLHWMTPRVRMIVRQLMHRPARYLMSALAVSFSVGLLIFGRFGIDAFGYLIDTQFRHAQREDIAVSLVSTQSAGAAHDLNSWQGVRYAEAMRSIAVDVSKNQHIRKTAIMAYSEHPRLRRLFDRMDNEKSLPRTGIMLSSMLAKRLHAKVGDTIRVRPILGGHQEKQIRVSATIDDAFGLMAYMNYGQLRRYFPETPSADLVLAQIDP